MTPPSRAHVVGRRQLLRGVAAASAGFAVPLAGCGGGDASDELVLWTISSFAPNTDNALSKALTEASEALGFPIHLEVFPHGSLRDKLITAVRGGVGPDVVSVDGAWTAQMAASGVAMDLSDKWASRAGEFFPGPAQTGSFDGKQYAVPWYANNVALFYNQEHFDKAGITQAPATWEDFLGAAKELTGGGQHGFMMGTDLFGTFLFWPFLWQAGGAILDEAGANPTFASAAGHEAWEFLAGLYLTDQVVPSGITAVRNGWDELWAPFVQGKVSMMMVGDWAISALAESAPDLGYAIAPLPRHTERATVVGGYNLLIPTTSKRPDQAWRLVDWLTKPERDELLASYDRMAARKDASLDGLEERYRVFRDQADIARSRPSICHWSAVEAIVGKHGDQTLQRQASPAAALDAAANEALAALSK